MLEHEFTKSFERHLAAAVRIAIRIHHEELAGLRILDKSFGRAHRFLYGCDKPHVVRIDRILRYAVPFEELGTEPEDRRQIFICS